MNELLRVLNNFTMRDRDVSKVKYDLSLSKGFFKATANLRSLIALLRHKIKKTLPRNTELANTSME